jgi:hypothetical protein
MVSGIVTFIQGLRLKQAVFKLCNVTKFRAIIQPLKAVLEINVNFTVSKRRGLREI